MLKAVIFDVDGVLVDSLEANIFFYQSFIVMAGYPPVSREAVMQCFHLPFVDTVAKLTGNTDPQEAQRMYERINDPSLDRYADLFTFPERLEEYLEKLHHDYKLGIVTSRVKVGVDDVLGTKNLQHLFDAIVTFEDYKHAKPHPEPLLVALKRLGITASEALYIGDSSTDIDAAHAAGMRSIYLSEHEHDHATVKIKAFDELLNAIEEIKVQAA